MQFFVIEQCKPDGKPYKMARFVVKPPLTYDTTAEGWKWVTVATNPDFADYWVRNYCKADDSTHTYRVRTLVLEDAK